MSFRDSQTQGPTSLGPWVLVFLEPQHSYLIVNRNMKSKRSLEMFSSKDSAECHQSLFTSSSFLGVIVLNSLSSQCDRELRNMIPCGLSFLNVS